MGSPSGRGCGRGTSSVLARLLDEGLNLGTERGAFHALARYLMSARPAARARVTSRLGWHETLSGLVFVLPGAMLGGSDTEPLMLQADRPGDLPPLVEAGTLGGWQHDVAGRPVDNSRLVFALSCAFAAPLLTLTHAESDGFNPHGPSSIGKTAMLDAAGGSRAGSRWSSPVGVGASGGADADA